MATQDELLWLDDLPQVEKEAITGSQFGKLSMHPRYVMWEKKVPTEITREQWEKLSGRARSQEAVFTIDVQEFNPTLDFIYERKMQVGGRDWRVTFRPSVEEVMGADSMSAENMATTLRKLVDAYVEVHDVPQQPKKSKSPSEKVFNTIKLVRVFESREKCYAAYVERFGDQSGAGVGTDAPGWDETLRTLGWTPAAWAGQRGAMQKAYAEMSGMPETARCAKVASDYGVPVECVKQALGIATETVQTEANSIPF